MNYRRGLNWVFVVAALLWYSAAGLVLYPRWAQAIQARTTAHRALSAAPDGAAELRLVDQSAFLLTAPVEAYVLALALAWLVRELRSPPE
ncbi:MAG: hypothetical protein ACLQBJ_11575 [Bryobacteraceae bacterium]